MPSTIRGIFRGFKHITQIFAMKDREMEMEMEMEIGCPTNVKHVAHIGWDGHSGNAPTWMNEFKTGPDFASTSIANSGSSSSPWSSQDFGERLGRQTTSDMFTGTPPTNMPNIPKKKKHKKHKSTSSASPRTSLLAKLKA